MKKFSVLALAFCITIDSFSQVQDDRKSGLFRQLPDSIPVETEALTFLFGLNADTEVKQDMSRTTLPIEGTVIASLEKYGGRIQAVSIRSILHEGAVFQLNRSVGETGVKYRGTWIHPNYREIFVLSQNGNEYFLQKKLFKDLVFE